MAQNSGHRLFGHDEPAISARSGESSDKVKMNQLYRAMKNQMAEPHELVQHLEMTLGISPSAHDLAILQETQSFKEFEKALAGVRANPRNPAAGVRRKAQPSVQALFGDESGSVVGTPAETPDHVSRPASMMDAMMPDLEPRQTSKTVPSDTYSGGRPSQSNASPYGNVNDDAVSVSSPEMQELQIATRMFLKDEMKAFELRSLFQDIMVQGQLSEMDYEIILGKLDKQLARMDGANFRELGSVIRDLSSRMK